MNTVPVAEPAPRGELILPRILAAILFAFAALIGLPTALASVGSLFSGDMRAFGFMALVVPLVWVLVWLGRVLWSGRPIPRWFIVGWLPGLLAIPAGTLLMKGSWTEALYLLAIPIPMMIQVWSVTRPVTAKPSRPGGLDELL